MTKTKRQDTPEEDSTSESSRTPRRKRKWIKRFLILLILLAGILGIAQGPGLRWAAEKYGPGYLEPAGLTGSFRLEGSLLTGLTLVDVDLQGTGPIREIKANRLSVDYQLTQVIHGKIDSITGDSILVWVDLNQKAPDKKKAKPSDTPTDIHLEKIRQMILPIELNLTNTTIRITQGPQNLWSIKQTSFTHKKKAEDFNLNIGTFTDMDDLSQENISVSLVWKHDHITLSNTPIRTDTRITNIDCHLDNITLKQLQAHIHWEDADFSIHLNELKRARIQLTQGKIDLDKVAHILQQAGIGTSTTKNNRDADEKSDIKNTLGNNTPPDGEVGEKWDDNATDSTFLDFGGVITTLNVSVDDIFATPTAMNANAHITGEDLRWEDRKIQLLDIEAQLHQASIELNVKLNTADEKTNALKLLAKLNTQDPQTASDWATCWHNATAKLSLNIPEPKKIATWSGSPPPEGGWPTGPLHLFIKGGLDGKMTGDAAAQIEWKSPQWGGLKLQQLQLTGKWDHVKQTAKVTLNATHLADGEVNAFAEYSVETQHYNANASIRALNIEKLRPVLDIFKQPIPRAGIVDLTWEGQGVGADILTYQGKINTTITGLDAEPIAEASDETPHKTAPPLKAPPIPPTSNIELHASYEKGLEIHLQTLQLNRDKLQLNLAGSWKNQRLDLPLLELHNENELLVKGSIQLPLSTDFADLKDLKSFRQQKGDINIGLHIKNLTLEKIYQQIPGLEKPPVSGQLTTDLTLTGTLASPAIEWATTASKLTLLDNKDVPSFDVTIKLITQDQQLKLDGVIKPDSHQPIVLNGQIPFNLDQWIDNHESIMEEPILALIDTKTISLAPFAKYLPHFDQLDGSVSVQVKASGTINTPQVNGYARLKVKRLNSIKEEIPDLRDLNIDISFTDKKVLINPSTCIAAGGKYKLHGEVDLKEISNPIFDITLEADKALLWRDDMMIFRADAKVKLTGPYQKAHLSGEIGILQSLFYKDIQIMPLGGSSPTPSLPGKANLPSFKKPKVAGEKKPSIPDPFGNWTLDLKIKTKEPVLIRGNLAKGNVIANIAIKGTIADVKPSGKAIITDLDAVLPFSQLHVKKGEVLFTPATGFDPRLNIKATSRVGSTDVEITVYGKASSPQHILSSSPPLPENEIIFLLATGSTSEKLTNEGAAAGKAYQLLVDTWLRSNPTKFKALKTAVSKLNQTVNINIGASDPFTGKIYNSATLKIHDRWYIIASMDLENNTRGLFLYTIRFK